MAEEREGELDTLPTDPTKQENGVISSVPTDDNHPGHAAPGQSSPEREESFSPREELILLADEWIAQANDEQEKKALLATKEELLLALDGIHGRGGEFPKLSRPSRSPWCGTVSQHS